MSDTTETVEKPWYKKDLREFGRLARVLVIIVKITAPCILLYFAVGVYGFLAVKYHVGGRQFPFDITGRSMETTIHQPIPLGSLSFGAVLWIDREAEIVPNSMVLFWTPDGALSVKRITLVDNRFGFCLFTLEPDNMGRKSATSGEGSGFGTYKEIPESSVVGTVTRVWTLRRAIRWFTSHGRFVNNVEFRFPTDQVVFSPNGSKVLIQLNNGAFKFADSSGRITGEMRPVKKPSGVNWVNDQCVSMRVTNGCIYLWPDGRWKRTLEFPDAGSLSYTMRLGKGALLGYEQNKRDQKALEALSPEWSEIPEGTVFGIVYMGPPINLEVAGQKVGLGGRCSLVGGAEYHVFPKPIKGGDIRLGQVDVYPPFLLYAVKQ